MLRSILRGSVGKLWLCLLLVIVYCVGWIVVDELQSSRLQAGFLSEYAQHLKFRVEPGPNPALRFSHSGPYDERLGYSQIAGFQKRLTREDYAVVEQARLSPQLAELIDSGLFPPYREKEQAGLDLLDCNNRPLYSVRFPERVYERFEAVPPLLVDALLFIEDHELLDAEHPMRNPAVEWGRFAKAAVDQLRHIVDPSHETPGGSTLATQIEKYRHSPDGRTTSGKEKLRQMASASVRAYLNGENTLATRRQIVVAYLNTVPLSARPGYGEINGLGDGLWAWYGRDFGEVNALLKDDASREASDRLPGKAEAFKQALSLMIAQRRPTYYLGEDAEDLEQLTDSYLRLLAQSDVIAPALRDAALAAKLNFRADLTGQPPVSFITRKAATTMRTALSGLLGVPRLYDLDRFDLTVGTTLNGDVQRAVTNVLRQLKDPATAKSEGLYGFHMLSEGDNPDKLIFSFTLFERSDKANMLRVQTDNFDQPFDINEGARLDLGSTAKLRTLVTYLEIIADLHEHFAAISREELSKVQVHRNDVLSRWAIDYLHDAEDRSLAAMLDAAMVRRYSANPAETFFTGGGVQTFENFEPEEDYKVMSVREAFQHSVNLVFIRLMRDVARHYMFKASGSTAELLEDTSDPRRQQYLSRFADREGREFITRFYRKYRGKTAQEAEDLLLQSLHLTPKRLAVVFRSIEPDAGIEQLGAFLHKRLPDQGLSEPVLHELYDKYGVDKFSLADRGFLAGVHPLELWLVGFLRHNPGSTLHQVVEASRDERQAVYVWLFKTRNKNTQDRRIQNLVELEAFLEIGRAWQRLGYPFESLTPSYAAAIGASGDRPAALAELMGIIVNKGMRLPIAKIETLHFAAATPFETRLERVPGKPERVMREPVAEVVRRSLVDVVEGGTAKRLQGAFRLRDGSAVEVGGKTGTGDHRFDVFAPGGRLISSRVVNRSATFVFQIGDRFFGTITAYVHEPYAVKYKFTSAISVQLLKSLTPALLPLLDEQRGGQQVGCRR